MSQAAVSYQIKRLEIHLAQTVFRRSGRGVSLTEDGERIAKAVIRAFNLIEEACGGRRGIIPLRLRRPRRLQICG